MHIAINGWFYDQESTGSGQYLRQLIKNLPAAAEELELSLILPPRVRAPKGFAIKSQANRDCVAL